MSKRHDIDFIEDILISLQKIKQYILDCSYEEFLKDDKTQDAVIRNIEIIGEASKKISPALKSNYPDIPWKMIAGTRDKLIHGYFGVNIDIIWEIATIDVPLLGQQMQKIKDDFSNQ